MTELKKIHKRLKVMIGGTSNTSEKSKMLEEAKSNLQKVVDSNEESKEYQELTEELEFMKDVKTIDPKRSQCDKIKFFSLFSRECTGGYF